MCFAVGDSKNTCKWNMIMETFDLENYCTHKTYSNLSIFYYSIKHIFIDEFFPELHNKIMREYLNYTYKYDLIVGKNISQ
jgi:hypothetical protein